MKQEMKVTLVDNFPEFSLSAGSIRMGLTWHDQPLHSKPALILELPLTDGILAMLVFENRLVIETGKVDDRGTRLVDCWITPKLIRPNGSTEFVSVQWSDGRIVSFQINAVDLWRADEAEEFVIEPRERPFVPDKNHDSLPRIDFEDNIRSVPKTLKFRQLVQTVTRLERRMNEMRSNNPEIILDIAVLLRTLLTGGTKNDGGRLLFRCADSLGLALKCYTVSGLEKGEDKFPLEDHSFVRFDVGVAGIPKGNFKVETDLELWMYQPALVTREHSIQHWNLIREIADKFGAHADIDETPLLLPFMSPHDPGINLGLLRTIIHTYGNLALEVSQVVFDHASCSSNG